MTPQILQNELFAMQKRMLAPDRIDFKREELESSIPARFEKVVALYPAQVALKEENRVLCYKELNSEANRLARTLLSHCGERTEPIVLLFENGISMLSAILGVLKSGKLYVALDPSYPTARIATILDDSHARVIITNVRNSSLSHTLAQNTCQVIKLEELDSHISDENLELAISSDSLAAIFYTSGSTGQPKGILKNHRSLLHLAMFHSDELHLGPHDRLSLLFSCSFGASISVIYGALLNGARLCFYASKELGLIQLATWLREEDITFLLAPVALFRQFLTTLTSTARFPKLRFVVLTGQTLHPKDVKQFRQYFPGNCTLINRLALSETSVITQYRIEHDTAVPHDLVPVGYPLDEVDVRILDETQQDVGVGEIGEIAVQSRYLSPGYLNDPELTRQKFLPDPEGGDKRICLTGDLGRMRPDGCLEYLGRKDFQVKIRGYRVELMEVEVALHALATVKETVVTVCDDQCGEKQLVAYCVPVIHAAPTISDLRRTLAEKLPGYMIPSKFVLLDALPLTSTGKVNRDALPAPDASRPDLSTPFLAPRNDLERQLAKICEEVLGIHPVGVKDNFFDLGGNSISFVRLLTEIEHLLGNALPANDLLATPSIEKISKMLRLLKQTSSLLDQGEHSSPPDGYNPLRVLLHLLRFRHLSWSKKRSRSSEIIQEVLSKHGPTFGKIVLPYPLGARFLRWFCGNCLVQSCLLHKQVHLFKTFLPTVSRAPDAGELIRQHLAANLWKHWRVHALARCTPQQFERWVTVSGLPTLQHAYDQRCGVILVNSHFVVSQVSKLALKSLGFTNYQAVGGGSVLQAETLQLRRARHASGTKAIRRSFLHLLSKFHEAQKTLKAGGIMSITGDGGSGLRGVRLPFHGRLMEFKTGFAEVAAIHTSAAVIPVFISLKPTGHIHVDILEPLDTGTPEMSHEQRMAWLMRQYVSLLEQRWLQEPQNLEWGMIERFLALAPIDG